MNYIFYDDWLGVYMKEFLNCLKDVKLNRYNHIFILISTVQKHMILVCNLARDIYCIECISDTRCR